VSVRYYVEGKKIFVEDSDELFDTTRADIQELVCSIKYPSQGDVSLIMAQANQVKNRLGSVTNELDLRDFIQLEFIRLMVLVRKWNLKEKLNNENVLMLHPKIVKALVAKVRNEIEMDGIF
jgi:hypothetical protein